MADSSNGWTAYVAAYKAANPDRLLTEADYKILMQQYIRGIRYA